MEILLRFIPLHRFHTRVILTHNNNQTTEWNIEELLSLQRTKISLIFGAFLIFTWVTNPGIEPVGMQPLVTKFLNWWITAEEILQRNQQYYNLMPQPRSNVGTGHFICAH